MITEERIIEIVKELTKFPLNSGAEQQILGEDTYDEIGAVLIAEINHEMKPHE